MLLVGVVLVGVVLVGVVGMLPLRWMGVLLVGVLVCLRLSHRRRSSHRDCHQDGLPREHTVRHDDLHLAAIRRVD